MIIRIGLCPRQLVEYLFILKEWRIILILKELKIKFGNVEKRRKFCRNEI